MLPGLSGGGSSYYSDLYNGGVLKAFRPRSWMICADLRKGHSARDLVDAKPPRPAVCRALITQGAGV